MNIWFWIHLMKSFNYKDTVFIKSAFEIAVTMFEVGREIWGVKKLFTQSRPIQDVRRFYFDEIVKSPFGGLVEGKLWSPYQKSNFITPPFADIPSGHSAFSKSFALIMNKYFGESIPKNEVQYQFCHLLCPILETQTNQLGSFQFNKNSSQIQANIPSDEIELKFETWDEMAQSAGYSRLYGGIHAISAHVISTQLAEYIHSKVSNYWQL